MSVVVSPVVVVLVSIGESLSLSVVGVSVPDVVLAAAAAASFFFFCGFGSATRRRRRGKAIRKGFYYLHTEP